MPDSNTGPIHKHAYHVESITLPGPSVTVDPDLRRSRKLSTLSPSNRSDRAAKVVGATSFNLNENNGVAAFHDQVDISVSISKSPTYHSPAFPLQPM